MAMATQAASQGKQVLRHFLGLCYLSKKENAIRVRIAQLKLDTFLKMYFKEFEFVYAHDPEKKCKPGDTVLIQQLPEKMTRLITHRVVDIIYPLGDTIDPISGKPVYLNKYRDEVEKVKELLGKHDKSFNYFEAPPRGRLEGIRDFTDKETYVKYYDDPNDPQPYGY
ncbi:28S ribosomal protein S17, mitochondrial [Chelonus insularis]|uniref:28S ribosomal protein S17, mitochondrial n=1 Tax=Chelonus insularis TaxID=460826 RepID=UPI00158ACE0F|nr:28S ribosomal protein S17, mitochondrial [Chelonus insularis]